MEFKLDLEKVRKDDIQSDEAPLPEILKSPILSPREQKKENNAVFFHPEVGKLKKKAKRTQELQTHSWLDLQYIIFQENWKIFVYIMSIMWDWMRYIFSFSALLFSFIIVSYAIILQLTSFYKEVPAAVSYLLLFILLGILALMEGIQIAVVELMKLPIESLNPGSHAYDIAQLTREKFRLPSFLMGRQVVVVLVVFLLGRLTTLNQQVDIWWIPNWFQVGLLQTGLFGALIVVIWGQLVPQVIASEHPIQFLNFGGPRFPFMKFVIYFTLFIEWTGSTHATWVIASGLSKLLYKIGLFKESDNDYLIESNVEATKNTNSNNEEKNNQDILNLKDIKSPRKAGLLAHILPSMDTGDIERTKPKVNYELIGGTIADDEITKI